MGRRFPAGIDGRRVLRVMEGYIEAKFTQETTLEFIVDDAIRVYINDEPVLDGWDYHSDEIISCTFDTVAGQKYKIRIEYADFSMVPHASCVGTDHTMKWKRCRQSIFTCRAVQMPIYSISHYTLTLSLENKPLAFPSKRLAFKNLLPYQQNIFSGLPAALKRG